MRTRRMRAFALVISLVPALGACGGDDEVDDDMTLPPASEAPAAQTMSVTGVELGRAIDAQGSIAGDAVTDDFTARDTIYVSVNTDGAASGARLTARWMFEDGQLVDESSQTISPTGPAITEFHISNPDGLPAGSYTVEIQLDGRTVATEAFEIT